MNIQQYGKLFNSSLNKIKYSICLTALFLSIFSINIAAQDSLRDFLKNKSEKPVKNTSSTKRNSSRKTSARNTGQSAKRNDAKTSRNLINVTFVTGEPFAEIWLNDKRWGLTDENARLEKKISIGEHQLMAKNKTRVIFPWTKISISSKNNLVKLFDEKEPEPVAVEPDNAVEKKKTDEELALEVNAEVKRILQDYADPKKTDTISTSDWEMVYKATQLGQLQGSSAVDVEAQRWFASGQMELAQQNFTNAFTAFNKAVEFMPNSGLLYYAIGNTYLANKQPSEALKAYQKSLQLAPKLGMVYKKMGDTLKILDREKESIAAYKNAAQFGYDNVETKFGLALTLIESKQFDEAIALLKEVENEKPTSDVFIALGEAYEKTKRDVSAIEYYQKAIQASPNSAAAYFNLGDVYFSQREYVKAKETYEKAVQLDPEGKIVTKVEAQKKLREAASKIK